MKWALLAALIAVSQPSDGARLTSDVVLVVDCSGSMLASHARAVELAGEMAAAGSDSYRVHAVTFGDASLVYPGGWSDMPDAEALAKIVTWLHSQRPPSAGISTRVAPALAKAWELSPTASVIVISDGEISDKAAVPEGRLAAFLQVGHSEGPAARQLGSVCKLGWYRSE